MPTLFQGLGVCHNKHSKFRLRRLLRIVLSVLAFGEEKPPTPSHLTIAPCRHHIGPIAEYHVEVVIPEPV